MIGITVKLAAGASDLRLRRGNRPPNLAAIGASSCIRAK